MKNSVTHYFLKSLPTLVFRTSHKNGKFSPSSFPYSHSWSCLSSTGLDGWWSFHSPAIARATVSARSCSTAWTVSTASELSAAAGSTTSPIVVPPASPVSPVSSVSIVSIISPVSIVYTVSTVSWIRKVKGSVGRELIGSSCNERQNFPGLQSR